TADTRIVVALQIELLRLAQTLDGELRMFAQQGVAERRKIALVLPARIGHHPVEIVEQARDQEVLAALRRAQARVDGERIFFVEVGYDGLAVGGSLTNDDDVRQLPARGGRRVKDVLVGKRHAGKPHEREHLQPIAIVVCYAEQLGIGIKRDHARQCSAERRKMRLSPTGLAKTDEESFAVACRLSASG